MDDSEKRISALEQKVTDLEVQVQSPSRNTYSNRKSNAEVATDMVILSHTVVSLARDCYEMKAKISEERLLSIKWQMEVMKEQMLNVLDNPS